MHASRFGLGTLAFPAAAVSLTALGASPLAPLSGDVFETMMVSGGVDDEEADILS